MSRMLASTPLPSANLVPTSPEAGSVEPAFQYFRELHHLLPEPFFQTAPFLLFFALIGLLYWSIPRRWNTVRVWLLVIASFHFYAAWSFELAFLVTTTTVIDFLLARWLENRSGPRARRAIAFISIGMNLSILAYFKYKNFFLDSLNESLQLIGYEPAFTTLKLIVPFGISFYTFEAISYIVDVYRGKTRAERSLPHFLLFILFFPHLVAGPIVRAGDFLPQARRIKRWNWVRVQFGVQLFLIGFFKKVAIADRMALFCDETLAAPLNYSTSAVWLAVLAYAFRIYADFSGYSDMALGLAHLLGYRLTRNFDAPYLALNISDFWRRWHISLSTWLRDYVFIPLGGSRGSRWQTSRNLMITMMLGGLWHGASWSYVLWGTVHGLLLVGHRGFRATVERWPRVDRALQSPAGMVWRVGTTFLCVALAWVLFRPDLGGALDVFTRLFQLHHGLGLPLNNRSLWYLVILVLLCQWLVMRGVLGWLAERMPAPLLGASYALLLTTALVLMPQQGKTFIYFTF
jgi:alginate O-acetyltransferase complex protein AlgI